MTPSIDADRFRYALARFASGVTVVTAEHDGLANGSTVSAFASVSLQPPLVMVCIGERSLTRSLILDSGYYGVNVLLESQVEIARLCAGRSDSKLDAIRWSKGEFGVPLFEDCLMRLECRLSAAHSAGDHTILIGEVLREEVREGPPLIHFEGAFGGIRR